MGYLRFASMIAVSTAVMFGLMYLNIYQADHLLFSQTRMWMALLMGAVMAAIMLLFMRPMLTNRTANLAILVIAAATFTCTLWLVRSQATVDDIAYMQAMIPHHSIAVLTSENAQIRDQRVRDLADGIIATQVKEIAEMKSLIADLRRDPPPTEARVLEPTSAQ